MGIASEVSKKSSIPLTNRLVSALAIFLILQRSAVSLSTAVLGNNKSRSWPSLSKRITTTSWHGLTERFASVDSASDSESLLKSTSEALYTLAEIPGKGFGAIALRDIMPGELIMEEKPLISISSKKGWFTPSESYSEARVETEIEKLSDYDQDRFYALHGFMGHNGEFDDRDLGSTDDANDKGLSKNNNNLKLPPIIIYRTNAYPAGPGKSGLFPLISRLNSHCTPNVHYNWNENTGSSTIYSVSKISKGDEIVNCYIGLYISRLERMRYLWGNFGFSCSCKTCSLMGEEQEESDKRRMTLESLEEMTVTAILEKKKHLALDLVDQRLGILAEEGLDNAVTLYKCEYDAFLSITALNSSTSALIDDISNSADCTSSQSSNGEMLDLQTLDAADRAEAKKWLKKAYAHVVQAKGPESIESHKCFYYLSIFDLL
jgi:SET domain